MLVSEGGGSFCTAPALHNPVTAAAAASPTAAYHVKPSLQLATQMKDRIRGLKMQMKIDPYFVKELQMIHIFDQLCGIFDLILGLLET